MAKLSPLSTPSATREVLERHGLFTKYGLGQNFLVNDDVIAKILELASVQADDSVLEVGPGLGTLTFALLSRAASVMAVEKDDDLPEVLADTLAPVASHFTLLSMDALNLTEEILHQVSQEQSIDIPSKMVSNLPYAVAATVVLDYFQRLSCLTSATVMVQKEVADRMMAAPGSKTYGAYTVKLSLYTEAVGRFTVAPGNFFPPPRVDSAVLRLNRTVAKNDEGRPLTPEELEATCTMADAAFANRRKTLANSCKTFFANEAATLEALPEIFAMAAIDPKRRGETLTRDEFIRLGLGLRAAKGD